jgi:hypothetical protein
MSVGGSGGADDITNVPDLGDIRGKSGRRKKSAATEATQKRDQPRDSRGRFLPRGSLVQEAPVGSLESVATEATKAKLSKDQKYVLQEQTKYIAFTQSKTAAKEFSAGAIGGISEAAIEEARKFLLPGRAAQMSAAQLEIFKAEEKFIRATKGATAARDFNLKALRGLTDAEIEEVRKFDIPDEKSLGETIRTNLFGGFSAFGIVQSSLASFAQSIQEANKAINEFTITAIAGGRGTTRLATSPARAVGAALPGTFAATGAAAGAFVGAPIVGGAAGFLAGTVAQMGMDLQLGRVEAFDDAVTAATDDLIGLSPELTAQRAMQEVERLQMRIERASTVSEDLAAIEEARFDLERASYEQGTQMIQDNREAFINILTLLTTMVENQQAMSMDLVKALFKFSGRVASNASDTMEYGSTLYPSLP